MDVDQMWFGQVRLRGVGEGKVRATHPHDAGSLDIEKAVTRMSATGAAIGN